MQLTEQRIREIVREEIQTVLEERDAAKKTALIIKQIELLETQKKQLDNINQDHSLNQAVSTVLAKLDYSLQSLRRLL